MAKKSKKKSSSKASDNWFSTSANSILVSDFSSMGIHDAGGDSNHSSFVKSELVGKFIGLPRKQLRMEEFNWHYLYEPYICDDVLFDLNEDFDSAVDYHLFCENPVERILKFIMETVKEGENLKEAVHGCDLVTNRGTLAQIAAYRTPKTQIDYTNPNLYGRYIFTKFEGVIFAYKRNVRTAKEKESMNRKYYWTSMLDQKLMTTSLHTEPKFGGFEFLYNPRFGLFKTQITDSNNRKISCLVSAKVDGSDKDGKRVEINERSDLDLNKSWPLLEPNWYFNYKSKWWMQAALSNVDRFIVGLHDGDGVVKEVKELKMSDVEKTDVKRWEPENSVKFLMGTLKRVKKLLKKKPEGAILKLEFFTNKTDISATLINDDEREEYEILPPEFIKRFSTSG